ncbi:hypothetical protein PR048_003372 [Dryococelus australis]|uniref:Uncharacterized protein n=1 Tax=Dryococelus australis TaxID=614101 RepID=A0ABQ9INE2_9NEOP|nr:hypothetical protein PR048_003372 [Dryococelus australis]
MCTGVCHVCFFRRRGEDNGEESVVIHMRISPVLDIPDLPVLIYHRGIRLERFRKTTRNRSRDSWTRILPTANRDLLPLHRTVTPRADARGVDWPSDQKTGEARPQKCGQFARGPAVHAVANGIKLAQSVEQCRCETAALAANFTRTCQQTHVASPKKKKFLTPFFKQRTRQLASQPIRKLVAARYSQSDTRPVPQCLTLPVHETISGEVAAYKASTNRTRQQDGAAKQGTCPNIMRQPAPGNLLASQRPSQWRNFSRHTVANQTQDEMTQRTGPIPAFAWSDFGKPWKTEIRMTGPGTEPESSRLRIQPAERFANQLPTGKITGVSIARSVDSPRVSPGGPRVDFRASSISIIFINRRVFPALAPKFVDDDELDRTCYLVFTVLACPTHGSDCPDEAVSLLLVFVPSHSRRRRTAFLLQPGPRLKLEPVNTHCYPVTFRRFVSRETSLRERARRKYCLSHSQWRKDVSYSAYITVKFSLMPRNNAKQPHVRTTTAHASKMASLISIKWKQRSPIRGWQPTFQLAAQPTRVQNLCGAAVAERLTYFPPTKANRVTPDFRKWGSCWTMPLVCGFSRGYPVSPALSFRRCSILTPINLFGSQDLDVKSRPNLSTTILASTFSIYVLTVVCRPTRVIEVSMERRGRNLFRITTQSIRRKARSLSLGHPITEWLQNFFSVIHDTRNSILSLNTGAKEEPEVSSGLRVESGLDVGLHRLLVLMN